MNKENSGHSYSEGMEFTEGSEPVKMTDKERIEKEAEQFSKTLTSDWHKNQDAKLCYIAGANAERERIKHEEILSEQNAFHLVKALDLIDECYHFLRVHPPSKENMNYSKWESLVEETDYMREFNADAGHERHNKIEIETVEDGGGCYVAGVRSLTLEQFDNLLKEERNKAIDECIKKVHEVLIGHEYVEVELESLKSDSK